MDLIKSPLERSKRSPVRTCVGCSSRDDAEALVRLVVNVAAPDGVAPDGVAPGGVARVAVDLGDGRFGRGVHVHLRTACLRKARSGGIARSLRCAVEVSLGELFEQVIEASNRRITGLVLGAWRARRLLVGADVGCKALEAGAPLLIAATDAGVVLERGPITRAVAEGRAVAWGDKTSLGKLVGRDEVAVIVIQDPGIAQEVLKARRTADLAGEARRQGE